MYLKSFLISVVLILKEITTLVFEKDFISFVSIIEKLKTSVSKNKNVVEVFAEVITLRKLSEKNSIFFIVNWLRIEVDCQKFENKILIKRKMMFERLLIVIFFVFFSISESSFYTSFALFFLFFSFFSLKQLLRQLSYFFSTTTTFRSEVRFFSFCRFIFLLLSAFVTQGLIRKLFTHVFILKKIISKQFYRFFLSQKFFLSTSFFIVSIFFLRFLSLLWRLKFFVVRCFFLFIEDIRIWCSFMLSFFRKKNSLVRFSVFRERCFALKFFYLLLNQKIFFSVYLKKFSTQSSMWKNEIYVRKNWSWIKNK